MPATARALVVPMSGAIVILLTFSISRRYFSETAALTAACLMATSPVFLFQLVQPMSDVPVTACWLAAACALTDTRARGAIGAGLWSSLAVLVRPNLAPLLLPCAGLCVAAAGGGLPRRLRNGVLFVVASSLGCLLVAWAHSVFYGSPFVSGYGRVAELFAVNPVSANLQRYASWLWQTQSPFVYLAVLALAPFVARALPRGGLAFLWFALAFFCGLVTLYLPYYSFDHWTYLRFLLPGLPLVLVLASGVWVALGRLVDSRWGAAAVAVVGLLVLVQIQTAVNGDAFRLRTAFENRYRVAGAFIDWQYPPNAVFLSVVQSGSVRYYGHRESVRFDWLGEGELDRAVADLARGGFRPFFLLDVTEIEGFRKRFAAFSRLGRLDWEPRDRIGHQGDVLVFDPEHVVPSGRPER